MASLDINSIQDALKTIYKERAVAIGYEDRPFFAEIEKRTNFKGKHYEFVPRYEHSGGRSVDFAEALLAENPTAFEAFQVPRVNEFYLGSITGEALEAADGEDFSAADGLESQIDGSVENASNAIAAAMFRDGVGTIGTILAGSAINTTTLSLSNKYDVRNFYIGQRLQALNPSGPALRTGGAAFVTVSKINFQAGQLTLNGVLNSGITDVAAGDLVINKGDFNGKIKGLQAWCPATVGGSDSFLGVNRSFWRERLAGIYIDGQGANKEEIVEEVIAVSTALESKVNRGYFHPNDLKEFKVQAGSRVTYDRASASAFNMPDISFEGIQVLFGSRKVKIFADANCPVGEGFFVNLGSMHLRTLGQAPKFLNADKLSGNILRVDNADTYRYRMGMRGNLVVERPLDVIRVKW